MKIPKKTIEPFNTIGFQNIHINIDVALAILRKEISQLHELVDIQPMTDDTQLFLETKREYGRKNGIYIVTGSSNEDS